MAEYIEREALIAVLNGLVLELLKDKSIQCSLAAGTVVDIKDNVVVPMLAADVVEVVRCKDCVSFAYYKEPLKYKGKVWEGKCTVTGDLINDDNFFCRYGIRKMAQQKEGAEG